MTREFKAARRGGRLGRIGLVALRSLVALVFLLAAGMKLSGSPKMVAEFGEIGLGQSFRYFTGGIEAVGGLLLLWPRTAFSGAVILAGICGGALVAQLVVLHHDVVHVVVLGGLVVLFAWLGRPAGLGGSGR
jgi:putative oxidoreductase